MTDTITIKNIEFNKDAFCKMSKTISKWVEESKTDDLSDKVSARTDAEGLKIIQEYVDHHSENPDDEKPVAMKPIKPNVHKTLTDVFKEFDPWDGSFIESLDHNQRVKLNNIATEFGMMALINKICIYIAFHMTEALNKNKNEDITEAKMIEIFKNDLNIDMPNIPKPKSLKHSDIEKVE